MKTNNLITTLLLATILVATSCSQARYGHMTVKGKAGERVVNAERKAKTQSAEVVVATSTEHEEIEMEQSIDKIVEPEVISALAERAVDRVEAEVEKREVSKEELKEVVETLEVYMPPVVRESKVVQDAYDKAQKDDESASDIRSLIWLILVILLILLILDLVLKLAGWLSPVLGLIILILLLMWLLGMI